MSTTRFPAATSPKQGVPGGEDSIATRQSLLKRLGNKEDSAGWQEFFETYWGLIYRLARRAGLNEADAQDVVQETVIAVARKMEGFVYDPERGSFKAWLRQLTRWRIRDQLERNRREAERRHHSHPNDGHRTATVERVADPAAEGFEADWDTAWEENLLQVALERTKQRVTPASYRIYDCCVHEELSATQVARLLRVNVAKVYLARHRVGRRVEQELLRLRNEVRRREAQEFPRASDH
ncbi:MAG: sigma-70 family RNA polymerase sigma factor [Verrucomicrobiales bacterium]|nr:sigma-70 family RNA polymerase sigma factor [Verrucomicrobiales bacterium]MCP5526319.1 sigma-70 family RNA polymerase sigma factor [Verrucomicrobiales bacterium]